MRRDTCQISWKPKTPGNGFGPQCKTHSSHIWPHLISNGNYHFRLAYHFVWESNAAWWRSRRPRCKKYPQKAAAKRLPNLHKCLSTHKSHHTPICVLQTEYNDRMGRLEKAQTSQGSPWPGREQCVGTQNLQIHLQETPSWCLKVSKTTGLKMLGVLVYLCSKIYLQTFLTASGSCRPKTTYELWRKNWDIRRTLSCWPTWEIPKGMLLGTTPGQHVACNETRVLSFKLSSGRPPWPGQYWSQKTPSRSTNRANKQSRPGQFSNVMRYLSTCVNSQCDGSDVQIDCNLQLVLGSSWHHRSRNEEIDRNVI